MALFKKVACFTDIHFGLKSGSRTHNQDCEDFVTCLITDELCLLEVAEFSDLASRGWVNLTLSVGLEKVNP